MFSFILDASAWISKAVLCCNTISLFSIELPNLQKSLINHYLVLFHIKCIVIIFICVVLFSHSDLVQRLVQIFWILLIKRSCSCPFGME